MKSALYQSLSLMLVTLLGLSGCLTNTAANDSKSEFGETDPSAADGPVDTLSGSIPADGPGLADTAASPPPLPDVFGPDSVPPASSATNTTCGEIDACVELCGGADIACQTACIDAGEAVARAAYEALQACIEAHQCGDADCVESACGPALDVCHERVGQTATSAEVVTADDTCPEIFICFEGCAGDEGCLEDCYAAGSEIGRRGVDGIGACAQTHECADAACVAHHCADAIEFCEDGRVTASPAPAVEGEAGCMEIIDCLRSCANDDEDCADACIAEGTANGRVRLSALRQCIADEQCDSDGCVEDRCAPQVTACEADGQDPAPAAENAELSCVEIYGCASGCAVQDDACRQGCYARGTAGAQRGVDAVTTCLRTHECHDEDCAYVECGAEIAACEADAPLEADLDVEEDAPDEGPRREWNGRRARDVVDGTCDTPMALSLGLTQGTTRDAPDEMYGECGGQGAERVYRLTVERETELCIDTFGSDLDTVLYVHRDICGAARNEMVCNDDFHGLQSQVGFTAEPETDYFVIVDSFGEVGNFAIDVRRGPCR